MKFAVAVLGAVSVSVVASGCERRYTVATKAVQSAQPVEAISAQLEAKRIVDECMRTRAEVASMPKVVGTPELDSKRHHVLGRAKGLPVIFRRPPERNRSLLPKFLAQQSEGLDDPRRAYQVLKALRGSLAGYRKALREVLLPEGYFYAESPHVAQQLVTWIKLDDLFDEKEIWLLRGTEVHRLSKVRYGYEHADGPLAGQMATITLFDRVATSKQALSPALHVDLSELAREKGFDRMQIEHMADGAMNAKIRNGANGPWVDVSIVLQGARATMQCEAIAPADIASVAAWRAEQAKREKALALLRKAIITEVSERLPFDEPKEEVGQQDGSLRPAWEWAYRHGATSYSFNKVSYQVFDSVGRPHPPQVCIDFALDSFERGAGTWFVANDKPRERTIGTLDFSALQMPNRRSVERVVDYFRLNAGTFDVWDLGQDQRIRYQDTDRFFDFLKERADDFQPSDLVVIHGPKGQEAHYHSFLVYERDPVTGMPVLLAGNAGKPRIQSWFSVMQSAPLRSIKHRLRPSEDLLNKLIAVEAAGDVRAASSQKPVQ